MQIEKYLENNQPVIYKTFVNSLSTGKLSHAYLLSGSIGMPLKETAIYLAKSILCDDRKPLACNSCITCCRVDEGNYPDLMIFDGENSKIKKGDIEKITSNFDKTALEEKGIMIYILHLVETMTPIAVNSLLKFLEEPGKNIFAFLTTENETKVLPTIISRTQVLKFREIDRQKIIKEATNHTNTPIKTDTIIRRIRSFFSSYCVSAICHLPNIQQIFPLFNKIRCRFCLFVF